MSGFLANASQPWRRCMNRDRTGVTSAAPMLAAVLTEVGVVAPPA